MTADSLGGRNSGLQHVADEVRVESIRFRGRGVTLAADRHMGRHDGHGIVLMLHGGGQTRHSWARSARTIAALGWEVHTLDARGHGDSDWAGDGDYSPDAMVADLVAVVDALGAKPVVVGASMGAMIATLAEGERGNVAWAVVLVDWVPRIEKAGVERIMEFMNSAPDGFASLTDAAEAVRLYNPHRKHPGSLGGLEKNLRQRPDRRWVWHWDPQFLSIGDETTMDLIERRPRDAARQLTVPVLLVRGSRSDVVSIQGAEDLLELVPFARFADVSDAGHMVAGDGNSTFSGALETFLVDLTEM